jgi:1,2-dihydroxy-3-keto-5-methylthiopentene dioxygenase
VRAYWLSGEIPGFHFNPHPTFLDYLRLEEGVGVATNPDLAKVTEMLRAGGYICEDEVSLSTNTPDLETIKAGFAREHSHTADEVRYVISGGGIFDIRSKDDAWIRIEVETNDLIVIPAGRNHRFFLTTENRITAKRLFKDHSGWEATYRDGD